MLAVDVADLAADESEPFQGERGESDLHGPRVVETGVRLEVDVETLGEWLQPLDTLGAFKEGGRPGDQQIEAGKSPGIDLIDELPERVQALITNVASHALDGFHLIQDDEHADVARVPENRENSLEEVQSAEVVDISFHAGKALGLGSHVRLTGQPGEYSLRDIGPFIDLGLPISS